MLFESIVVEIILRIPASSPAITQMAALMIVSAMHEKLVFAIESPPTESTFGMTFEASLVDRERLRDVLSLKGIPASQDGTRISHNRDA